MAIFLYIIFLGLWCFINYKKNQFNISVLILLLYFIGAFSCLCIFIFYPTEIKYPERITIDSVASHIILMWLFMYPLIKYGNYFSPERLIISNLKLNIFSWCIIVPSLLAMAISIFDIIKIFSYGNLLAARMAFVNGDLSTEYVSRYGAIGYIMSLGPVISFLALFFFFYKKFYKQNNGIITWLLFLSSFCIVAYNLAIAGREGFVRWFFYCIFCSVFFKNYIKFKQNKKFFGIIGCFGFLLLTIFTMITIDRFEDSNNGPLYSLISYCGQQFYYYSYAYDRFFNDGYGSLGELFPIISNHRAEAMDINSFVNADYYLNTFSTFAGSFLKEAGFANTLFLAIFTFTISYFTFWRKKKYSNYSLTRIIAYLFYYEVILLGFFYFIHYLKFTQIAIVFFIILSFLICSIHIKKNVYSCIK